MQVLVNILEHPQCLADYNLTSPVVHQLAAELLSHILMEEHLQKDPVDTASNWSSYMGSQFGYTHLAAESCKGSC